ncbi:phage NrS-1 polymerase family protein [Halorarum salinum]|nr:hypothetical protein [Halobaculum salinum]
MYSITPKTVPATLKAQHQWVCWREESRDGQDKPAKVPINPGTGTYASVADPETWTTFAAAYTTYREDDTVAGVGFVFTPDDPYVGADLDDCRDPATGKLADWTRDIVQRLDSYTEASPSGTGVHVLVRGEFPDGKCRNGDVELYDRDRYFTVTGRHLSLTPPTVNDRTEPLSELHEEYLAADTGSGERELADGGAPEDAPLADADLLEYALNASNGEKFDRLWRGDTAGYASHSEADQALCNLLAFWTGGDAHQIERLFSKSGLIRDKWRDRPNYRKRTIETAISDCPAFYDPEH